MTVNKMHRVFGAKENAEYLDREGAYLIPRRGNCVAVIQTTKGYFLLGGGLKQGESHLACIERECIEEAGCSPIVEGSLCSAEAYIRHPAIGYFHPIQSYYFGNLIDEGCRPTETDHVLLWMEYEQLKGKMYAEMQNWALEQLFE